MVSRPTRRDAERHLLVLAHPAPGSFNRALADAVEDALRRAGSEVVRSSLYEEGFDPTLTAAELDPTRATPADVRREQERLALADAVSFFFPVWWYDRPAILKGWCDRVLRPGFAYGVDPETGAPRGLLGGRRANLIVTLGAAEGQVELDRVVGSMIEGTLGFCGIDDVEVLALHAVTSVGAETRQRMLDDVRELMLARRLEGVDG